MSTQAVLRHRRDTAANWTTNNPILEAGQVGFETDTLFWKFGDGITAWTALLYPVFSPGALNDLTNVIETAPVAGQLLEYNGTNWVNVTPAAAPAVAVEYQLSASDLTTALTAGTSKAYFRAPRAFLLTGVRASVLTAAAVGIVTIDIKKNGVTLLTTLLTIDATEKTSVTAAVPAVIDATTDDILSDDEITVDITVPGDTAAGLIVTMIGTAA